ncbi:hypothetical protein [Pseudomonas linyingensis]|uniref:hypothetical protein n=1 Tax=Pseudomonas linyingensis TaxID=915471 RepID=UPI0011137A63|nr:hypothetical protein [Pseudomonas linyingensis]
MLIDQLMRPFGYLSIRHPHKWVVDWGYPIFLAALSVLMIYYFGEKNKVIGAGGIVSLTLSFIQSLPGFYIAALAAIATFGRSDIDSVIPSPTPKVKIKILGKESFVDLTRRRFLAMLFAFLTGESIILILFSIFLSTFGSEIIELSKLNTYTGEAIFFLLIFTFFTALYQMIVATFWGLYYLGYKLHE